MTIVECVNICDTDAFKVSLMMQNKGGKQSFDPFMFSLMTEQSQVRQYSEVIVLTFDLCLTGWYLKGGGMNPMMLQMMMNNKMSDMGPLMPLFMTGKTAEDPLLMMMLMAQKADPKTTQNQARDHQVHPKDKSRPNLRVDQFFGPWISSFRCTKKYPE